MSEQKFILHPRLEEDCFILGEFDLCLLLLMNDNQYPWFILVPQKNNIREIYELEKSEQQQLLIESSVFSEAIQLIFNADKLNIAALGNMVPQLHVHHIVRYKSDIAWPGPIWGIQPAQAYLEVERKAIISKLKSTAIAGLSYTD